MTSSKVAMGTAEQPKAKRNLLEDLPHEDAKAPNVTAFREDFLLQTLNGNPLESQFQAVLQDEMVLAFVQTLSLCRWAGATGRGERIERETGKNGWMR